MSHVSDLDHRRLDATVYPDCVVEVHRISDIARGLRKVPVAKIWRTEKVLGRGTFGEVQLQVQDSDPKSQRAVKVIPTQKRLSTIDCERELTALIEFTKPKYKDEAVFVQFLGWFQTDNAIHLAMEYIPLGDLENNLQELEKSRDRQRHIAKHASGVLATEEVKDITTQILEGVKIMHAEGFAHRDLKPQNVLVVQREPHWWVKLGDFGLSKRRTEASAYRSHAGTQSYMAPEMFHYVPGLNPESSEYTNAVDIWALGCIIHRILTGKPPFPDLWSLNRYCSVPKLEMFLQGPSQVETRAEHLVQMLLTPQPGDRLTATTALRHPWLSSNAQTHAVETSPIIQRTNHHILADNTPKAVPADTKRPYSTINSSKSQANYNTASHAGLLSNYLPEVNQSATLRYTPANQWPEADRQRMREPMPGAFEVEQFDAINSSEKPAIVVGERKSNTREKKERSSLERRTPRFVSNSDRDKIDQDLEKPPTYREISNLRQKEEQIRREMAARRRERAPAPPKLSFFEKFKGVLLGNLPPPASALPEESREKRVSKFNFVNSTSKEQLAKASGDWDSDSDSDLDDTPISLPVPKLGKPRHHTSLGQNLPELQRFTIHIKSFTGYQFKVLVYNLSQIGDVKHILSGYIGPSTVGLSDSECRLNFEGKLLADNSRLYEHGIEEGSLIHCRFINK